MGLDFTHSDARWSYSGFNRFRKRLFNQTSNGLDLNEMKGFNHDCFGKKTSEGISFDAYNHGLKGLINHSDCEGFLTPEEMKVIEPALRIAVKDWECDYDKRNALMLCDGMIEAIEDNENMEFI